MIKFLQHPKFTFPVLVSIMLISMFLLAIQVIVEVLRGDHKEEIPVVLEPKPDES